jgi:hypothetical protein
VLEAVFVLLEFSSPLRRIFIGSHSLPPLWFAVSVLHKVGEGSGENIPEPPKTHYKNDLPPNLTILGTD